MFRIELAICLTFSLPICHTLPNFLPDWHTVWSQSGCFLRQGVRFVQTAVLVNHKNSEIVSAGRSVSEYDGDSDGAIFCAYSGGSIGREL